MQRRAPPYQKVRDVVTDDLAEREIDIAEYIRGPCECVAQQDRWTDMGESDPQFDDRAPLDPGGQALLRSENWPRQG